MISNAITTNKQSKYIPYFDFIRGIAILMVVALHTTTSCDLDSTSGIISTILRQCYLCAVPIFLACSAYFLVSTNLSTFRDCCQFWKKQIPKVYIPTLVWSIPIYIQSVFCWGGHPIPELIYCLICGYSIYYFIALIIQYYLLLPILKKYRYIALYVSIPITIISLIYYTKVSITNPLPLIFGFGPFNVWLLYFMLGIALSYSKRNYSLILPTILIILGIIAQYAEILYINNLFDSFRHGTKATTVLYSSGMILLLFSKKLESIYNKNLITSFVEFLGKKSFIIYLCHCYFIDIIYRICHTSYWSINFLLSITLTILFIIILERFTPKLIHKYIGLK